MGLKGSRGINRKGLTALLVKLEKDAIDARREFKKHGYYSSSVLSYQETLTAIRAIRYAWLERAGDRLFKAIERKRKSRKIEDKVASIIKQHERYSQLSN